MPLFSIIIPVYNVSHYLRTCLDSVLTAAEKCPNVEIVCVDDGSTDASGEILDEYRAKLTTFKDCQTTSLHRPAIKVVHQQNAGVSAARNVALDMAAGEWVVFVDADDYLSDDFLDRLRAALDAAPDIDVLEHSPCHIFRDGTSKIGSLQGEQFPAGVFDGQNILADPFGRRFTDLTCVVWNKLFKRSIIERAGLRFVAGASTGEDTIFSSCYYAYVRHALLCPDLVGYNHVCRDGSITMTISTEKLTPQIMASNCLYATWQKHPSPGLTTKLSATFVALAYLGKEHGVKIRKQCIDALLASSFWCGTGLHFILRHGTLKMRVFALAMILLPKACKRAILNRL